jgi:tRNA 5-methylaminomethyl-2-thiouridine biosynthesis bifunctional protein
MARLPPLPNLDWSEPARPRSLDLGDVYFAEDGFAEKRAVFVAGCGLPERWSGRRRFAIGELGFGAGLAFLAAWDAWRRSRPHPQARLDFLTFEGALMTAEDAARVFAGSAELGGEAMLPLCDELLARWPVRARGAQRIDLSHGVSLTIFVDDIAASLPQAEARIDAWFLDGFAPSKNPAMWSADVLAHVARLSAPGARAATYTVAGDVRRALEAAGFGVSKAPGAGRKRERLEAVFGSPSAERAVCPEHVVVVGGGVAGACTARTFLDRGARVTLLDAGDAPGAGASGNPLALAMPRLDAADGPVARALLAAYLRSLSAWGALGPEAALALSVRHLPRSDAERRRFAKLLEDPPLDDALLQPLDPRDSSAGIRLPACFAVRPAVALAKLLEGADLRFDAVVASIFEREHGPRARLASGEQIDADLVVVCAGMGLPRIDGVNGPPLEGRLGQVESVPLVSSQPQASSDGGYVLEAFGEAVFGATFEAAPEGEPPVTEAARAHNLAVLARLRPDLTLGAASIRSRASVRATTQDRLPFAGATNEKAPVGTPAPFSRVRLVGGLGSRGFLWAPLLAELVASEAFGEPVPLEASARAILDPMRFARRAVRRGG